MDFNGSESKWEFRLREVVAQLGMQPKKPLVELTSEVRGSSRACSTHTCSRDCKALAT